MKTTQKTIPLLMASIAAIFLMQLFFVQTFAQSVPDTVVEEAIIDVAPEYTDDEDTEQTGVDYFYKKGYQPATAPYQWRKIPEEKKKDLLKDDDFWYANTEFEKPKENVPKKKYTSVAERSWFQTLLWVVIIGAFIAALMWFLAENQVGLFRKKEKRIAGTDEDELVTEDIFAINYQREIDKAVEQGNYRLAIRLYYLRVLKQMAEKNIIQYKIDRTNLDYLVQLQSTSYYKGFFSITRNYEYAWYGLFNIKEDGYAMVRKEFADFEKMIG